MYLTLERSKIILLLQCAQGFCRGHSARLLQLALCTGAAASGGRQWLFVRGHQAHHRLLQHSEWGGPRPVKCDH